MNVPRVFEAKGKVGGKIARDFLGWIELNVARLFKLFHLIYSWEFEEDHNDKNCKGTLFDENVQ